MKDPLTAYELAWIVYAIGFILVYATARLIYYHFDDDEMKWTVEVRFKTLLIALFSWFSIVAVLGITIVELVIKKTNFKIKWDKEVKI